VATAASAVQAKAKPGTKIRDPNPEPALSETRSRSLDPALSILFCLTRRKDLPWNFIPSGAEKQSCAIALTNERGYKSNGKRSRPAP